MGLRSKTRSAKNEVQSNWSVDQKQQTSWPARRSLAPSRNEGWRRENWFGKRKRMRKDELAELAIKEDIEDSWKKKSGNYCCMCLFFFPFSLSNFSAFWDYNSGREKERSKLGWVAQMTVEQQTGNHWEREKGEEGAM